jgi:hypothetical protein
MLVLITSFISDVLHDTLTKDGKWSRTSLTMFSAWIVVIFMALFDFCRRGLQFDVWVTLVVVATGIKITDAWSKKIIK